MQLFLVRTYVGPIPPNSLKKNRTELKKTRRLEKLIGRLLVSFCKQDNGEGFEGVFIEPAVQRTTSKKSLFNPSLTSDRPFGYHILVGITNSEMRCTMFMKCSAMFVNLMVKKVNNVYEFDGGQCFMLSLIHI